MAIVYKIYNIYDKIFSNKLEKDISEISTKIKKKKITIYDIGCYTGSFSARLEEQLKKKFKTKYYLFDPNLDVKNEVKKRKFNYKFFSIAASNKEGTSKFNLNTQNSWSGSSLVSIQKNSKLFNFSRNLISLNIGKKLFKTIFVKTTTLDKFIKKKNTKVVDILKIDVEGAELKVLHGFSKNISNTKIVYVEVLDEKKKWKKKFTKIERFMKKNNFYLFKTRRIIEGSILSSLKIVDALYVNKSLK